MDTDIFGEDTSGGLDLSDEALDARAEPDLTQVEPVDGTPSDEGAEPEAPAPEDEGSSDDGDESETPASEDSFTLPDKLQGKSAEEIARMYVEKEKLDARQASELGELRRLVEEQNRRLEAMSAQADEFDEDPSDYITTPDAAAAMYRQAIEALDTGKLNDPSVIDEIIDITHELDPKLAAKMNRDFGMRLARAEVMAHMQPVQQTSYETVVRQATNALWNDETLGSDAQAYNAEIVDLLKGRHLGNTQAEVAETLKQALIFVRGQDPTKSAAYRIALDKSKTDERVEEGSAEVEPPLSEEDKVRQGIFSHRQSSPADQLFAGFGG